MTVVEAVRLLLEDENVIKVWHAINSDASVLRKWGNICTELLLGIVIILG